MKYQKIRFTEWRDPEHQPHPELIQASKAHQAALNEWRSLSEQRHRATANPLIASHVNHEAHSALNSAVIDAKARADKLAVEMQTHEDKFMAKIQSHSMVGTFGWQVIYTDADGKQHCERVIDDAGNILPDAVYAYELIGPQIEELK